MAEITAPIRNTCSGILAGFIDVYSAVVDICMQILLYPLNEFLVVFLPPLQVALECASRDVKG
jgi:hypothetical protein